MISNIDLDAFSPKTN